MSVWVVTSSYPRFPRESVNAGVVARDLALGIRSAGHDVTIVTPDKPGGIEFDRDLAGLTIPWLRPSIQISDLSGRPTDLARAASLMINGRRLMREQAVRNPPAGIVALWGLPSGIFARWAAKTAHCPYAVWLLGSDVWRAGDFPGGRRLLSQVVRDASSTFADGVALAREATRITGERVEFLPSARRLPPATVPRARDLDILFVGRYHPNKGPDILLSALEVMSRDGARFTAEFHGSGVLKDDLERRMISSDLSSNVTLRPPIEAQAFSNRLAQSRVLAIPSRIESIPLVLGDAIQARTPVVATRVGDMGDLVEELGIGLTVDPEYPEAMAEALEAVIAGEFQVTDWNRADSLLSPDVAIDGLLGALDLGAAR